MEGTVNQVGERQDTLIHAVQLSNEISTKGKGIPPAVGREKAEIKFPRFVPSEASFDVDPKIGKLVIADGTKYLVEIM